MYYSDCFQSVNTEGFDVILDKRLVSYQFVNYSCGDTSVKCDDSYPRTGTFYCDSNGVWDNDPSCNEAEINADGISFVLS